MSSLSHLVNNNEDSQLNDFINNIFKHFMKLNEIPKCKLILSWSVMARNLFIKHKM